MRSRPSEIGLRRLAALGVGEQTTGRCDELVRRLGAVQAQDELASRWACGTRAPPKSSSPRAPPAATSSGLT